MKSILRKSSAFSGSVQSGLGAMKRDHTEHIDQNVRGDFADSLDLDTLLQQAGHAQEHRWDYLLGHRPSGKVVGLEPHSARQDEISTVIAKKESAIRQLSPHLKAGACIADWFWVASGNVGFPDTGKARRRLDQAGIRFVGTRVLPRDLPAP